jgi:hypothetical protein
METYSYTNSFNGIRRWLRIDSFNIRNSRIYVTSIEQTVELEIQPYHHHNYHVI